MEFHVASASSQQSANVRAALATTFPNVDPATGRINSQPNTAVVYEAIRILFHEQATDKKDLASAWLNAIQESVYAWKVADDLLQTPLDLESCYFAAQTLRTKIQHSFHELPHESIASLRDSIMQHIKKLDEHHAIQTQLCLAIVYLAILWSDWTSPIEDLAAQLAIQPSSSDSQPNDANGDFQDKINKELNQKLVLIDLLTLMPEEIERSSLKVGANRREQFRKYLANFAPQVINLLNTTLAIAKQPITGLVDAKLSSKLERLVGRVYRCFAAWITILPDYTENQMSLGAMLTSIFADLSALHTPDSIHDSASDAVCAVALICEDYDLHSQLADFVLQQLYVLEPAYWEAVSAEHSDRCVNFTRMFTEMSESVVEPLVVQSEKEIRILELMLSCVGHYEYEVAEITFHFWYRFAELVYNSRRTTGRQKFGDQIIRLLVAVTRHCQLETDQEGLLFPESEVAEFRSRVSDMVKEIVVIVGAAEYIKTNQLLVQIRNNYTAKPNNWELVEADLFLISCLASELVSCSASEAQSESNPNYEINSAIITTILELNHHASIDGGGQSLHPQLLATCCAVLGGLASYFQHTPPPHLAANCQTQLDRVLKFLLDNIMKCGELSSAAAQSLQSIISVCGTGDQLTPAGRASLVTLLVQICGQLDHINNESTAQNLLQCCSTIISNSVNLRGSPPEELQANDNLILQLLTLNVIRLREIFDERQEPMTGGDSRTAKSDPLVYLDRIASIFRSLSLFKTHPEGDMVIALSESSVLLEALPQTTSFIETQLWPVLQMVLVHYSPLDARIIERSCRTVRYVIRCLHPAWLLDKIATQIVNLYQQFPAHSSFLYIGSILIDEFASPQNPAVILDGLVQMLHAFCTRTFAMLNEGASSSGQSPSGQVDTLALLRCHPDTVDDFFRLCVRFYQKLAQHFLSQSPLEGILSLTLACLALDHREANNSVVKFVTELLETSHTSPEVVYQLVTNEKLQFGARLVEAVMNACLFHLPSYFIPEMADIFWPLMKLNKQDFAVWLNDTLCKIPRQTDCGVPSATNEQLAEFQSDMLKASHPKQVAAALRFLHRLYR